MSEFLTKTVKYFDDGLFRTVPSSSPEQMLNRRYVSGGAYHQTIGCAFDQQMLYENGLDYLKAASLLGKTDDPLFHIQQEQIEKYHPIRIGWSGQIKEYEEENMYGEIGEYHHRHISQLVGLHPGTQINNNTPAWLDAAKYTLTERGDRATGWALAYLGLKGNSSQSDDLFAAVKGIVYKTVPTVTGFEPFKFAFVTDGYLYGEAPQITDLKDNAKGE